MSSQDEMVATFLSLTGGDSQEFARSFLESTGWNVEMAVGMMLDGGGPPPGGGGGGGVPPMLSPDGDALMGGASPNVRAPIPQMRDQLISHDPAQRGPRGPPPPTAAEGHALEAFRDFRRESGGAGGSGAGAAAGAAGGSSSPDEVFGLAKKPKNLAEIYKAPTDLCFQGTFEELRDAGRAQGRWLLVNIQSPTEFASQQLNADTWTDETLRAVVNARRARIHAHTHAAILRSTPRPAPSAATSSGSGTTTRPRARSSAPTTARPRCRTSRSSTPSPARPSSSGRASRTPSG
jgi:hypothetical protein